MNVQLTRRHVLAAIASAVPVVAMTKGAHALTSLNAEDAKFPQAKGQWVVLEHATDGTDPSTALSSPPAPLFTPAIKELAGKEIELTGFVTALAPTGFGKKQDYLLSREAFHCPYCYGFGRGSLALAQFDAHIPPTSGKVTVRGTLALQSSDPSDFYFQLKNARLV